MNRQTKIMESLQAARQALAALQAEAAALLGAQGQAGMTEAASAVQAMSEQASGAAPWPSGAAEERIGADDAFPALDGEALGYLVTRTVNDEIGRAARRRRYTG